MEYTNVNIEQMNQLVKDGTLKPIVAVKDVAVKAVELTQEVVDKMLAGGGYQTVVIDDQGKPFVETTNKKINVGDFLVTNKIVGYENSYVVPAAKFATLYTSTEDKEVFNPVATDKNVFKIPKEMNLVFEAPWGGEMKIRGGGVIVPDGEKFYGINPEEFNATHSIKSPVAQRIAQVKDKMSAPEPKLGNTPTLG